jgi:hypothetical protein
LVDGVPLKVESKNSDKARQGQRSKYSTSPYQTPQPVRAIEPSPLRSQPQHATYASQNHPSYPAANYYPTPPSHGYYPTSPDHYPSPFYTPLVAYPPPVYYGGSPYSAPYPEQYAQMAQWYYAYSAGIQPVTDQSESTEPGSDSSVAMTDSETANAGSEQTTDNE